MTTTSRQGAAWQRYRINARLRADTHLGSGTGSAEVDALVARDRRGRPVIWASHVEGVLRDAARRPRNRSIAGDDALAAALFGRPIDGRGGVLCSSLYTGSDVRCRIRRSSARKAFDNRAPRDETLRVVEYVPAGTEFEGFVEIPSEYVDAFRDLLSDADAIGSGRASNAGSVRLELSDLESAPPRSVGGTGPRLRVLLRGIDPVCIAATANPGNIVPTAAYIPGRTLNGALAAWLHGEGRIAAATAVTSGALSVGDALPLADSFGDADDLPSIEVLPAPLALGSDKPIGPPGALPWWSQPIPQLRRIDSVMRDRAAEKPKRPEPDLFVVRNGGRAAWEAYRPVRHVRLRNGRAGGQDDEPQLFATEYLAERTLYLADISGDEAVLDDFCAAASEVLDGRRWLRVGRGGAPVEVVRAERMDWPTTGDVPDTAILTLTSDLLVRDEQLNWVTAINPNGMVAVPGLPEGVIFDEEAVQERVTVHGFNGTSRMRRRPIVGIRRGSTFRVSGEGVRQLAAGAGRGEWLGEQTSWGFGRYRVDALLPGVMDDPTVVNGRIGSADDPEEVIAATTRRWFDERSVLARSRRDDKDVPSISQWFDFVAELGNDPQVAISRREDPATAGGQVWRRSAAASDIVRRIKASPNPHAYAEIFVRWLRTARDKEDA